MSARPFLRILELDPRGPGVADLTTYTGSAKLAERLGFDAVLLPATTHLDETVTDPWAASTLEPITVLSAVAAVTDDIGLVAPVATTLTQPYALSRRLSALDFISSGRAGWQPVVSIVAADRANLGWTELTPEQSRERSDEYVDVVTGLWHSWLPDARVIDKDAGVYLDLDRISAIDHAGPHFQVSGPIDSPRPPQGHPVLVTDEPAERWGPALARAVDLVIVDEHAVGEAEAAVVAALTAAGRGRSEVRLLLRVGADRVDEAVRRHGEGAIDGAVLRVDVRAQHETTQRLADRLATAGLVSSDSAPTLRARLGLPLPSERLDRTRTAATLQTVNG